MVLLLCSQTKIDMAMAAMVLICSLVAVPAVAMVTAGDEATLLAFKVQVSDGGSLASWNSSTDFCSWEGVTCSHRRPGRVVGLSLEGRGLTGALSPAIGNLTFLRTLNLSLNWLHGEIPASLGRLRCLQKLDLNNNAFSGMFPANLSSCVSMTKMGLHHNKLGGRIPAELGENLRSLEVIFLRNNSFTGPIPASLANLSYLQNIDLAHNHLVGSIPPGLGSTRSMRWFNLFNNNLSGTIPPTLYNWSSLELFVVGVNMLYASIPDDIGNKFPKIKFLNLGANQFTGAIPSSISNLSYLIELRLSQNRFSGYVPPTFGSMGDLRYLDLGENKLEANDNKGWEFITSLKNCSKLEYLAFGGDSFGGQLPGSIVNLSTTLQKLYIMDNRVSGGIPVDIGNLIGLNLLAIANTIITREPFTVEQAFSILWQLGRTHSGKPGGVEKPGLSWYLDLSYNSLSGPLPYEVGSLANLNQLILSGNQLSQSLKNLKGLMKLNLTMNKFSGNIPDALGSIGNLQEIAVAGNINLCGGAPQLHLASCPTDPLRKHKKMMRKSLVSLAVIGAIFLSLSVILLVWIFHKKLKQGQKTIVQYSIGEDYYERIPYHALLRGTNGFSDDNLLGRGSYGVVYKCILDNEERTLAVKVFNLAQSKCSKSFETECEAMRRIRHRCLIKTVTSCSSVNHQGQEFKALVFEFMPNGNLDGWLHPKSQVPSANNTLSLVQRLEIAVNIVDAIEYLHKYCQPLIIHCDLKPSNILLADDMSARVADFGISRIIQENTSETMQNSYSSTAIRGSIGYVAPEYGEGSVVSPPGDIYSLGILLLEMLTGRSPTDDTFSGH